MKADFCVWKAYFDALANKNAYETIPKVEEVTTSIYESILTHHPFDKETTVVMDYACGTGLISKGLIPHSKEVIGVDISQGMVDFYDSRAREIGYELERMRAVCVELKEDDPVLDGQKFDVIAVRVSIA